MHIGIMEKNTGKTVHTYYNHRIKSFLEWPAEHFHQYEIIDGTDPRAYFFNGYKEELDTEWQPPAIPPQIMAEQEIVGLLDFGAEMVREFTMENLLLGITQAGKTGDVLSVLTERFLVDGNTRPISLMDTVQSGSLDQTIKIIDHLLANMTDYADLSPFITSQRLSTFRTKILTYLMG